MYLARLFPLFLLIAACDSAGSGDEDLTATRAAIVLESDAQTVSWSAEHAGGLVGGVSLQQDTLVLSGDTRFSGRLDLFAGATDLSARIRSNAERYQIFYESTGLGSTRISAADHETDYGDNDNGADLPVGLSVTVATPAVSSTQTGTVRIKVGFFGPGLKNGSTLTVDPVYDFVVPVRIVPAEGEEPTDPPDESFVNRFVLEMQRDDDLKTITMTATHPNGLDINGLFLVPQNINVETCVRETVDAAFSCTEGDSLLVYQGETYEANVTIEDSETGAAFTDRMRANPEEFRIFYALQFTPTGLTFDTDSNGLPVGLDVEWSLPEGIQIHGSIVFRVFEYDRESGGDKSASLFTAKHADFRIPFYLLPPE